ncbi:MAG TPA: glycosyltransferase family 4 protein, partial [Acidimicrobiales bacterium]|nr:glycosyltransferase family 4 protein [Acidimicrobiales bacterium]
TDPFCGDVVYTEALLENPPPGWTYVPYTDALRTGELYEHGRRSALSAATGLGPRGRALFTVAREHALNALRDRGALFREPFRFMEIRGSFDLVHCHTYSVRWTGVPTPVLVSNAVPLRELYEKARGWGARRVAVADAADRLLARALRVDHIEHGLGAVDRVVAFTRTLADWYVDAGVPGERVDVVPCFPAELELIGARRPAPGRVGFVAGEFAAKGGSTVLAAMAEVRRTRSDAHLVVAGGGSPDPRALEAAGATAIGYLPRRQLLAEMLPSCAVFAYPSRFDGLPLTLLEAMAVGLPCAVSEYFALPEIVGAGGRAVPGDDPVELARALLELLDPATNEAVGAAALERFRTTYSPEAVRPKLAESYAAACRDAGSSPRRRVPAGRLPGRRLPSKAP